MQDHTHPHIDLYCERSGPAFWAEPVNALSNLSFLIAALVALVVLMRRGRPDVLELALIALAAAIGIGSFLFHTFAQPWAELGDIVPIWSFVALFTFTAIYRATSHNAYRSARIAGIALVVTGAVMWLTGDDLTTDAGGPQMLNGSLQYLPAVIALSAFAIILNVKRHPAARLVVLATGTFLLSLLFRTIDLEVCTATGIGTHFLWHLLNGAMVGLLLATLIRYMPPPKAIPA